jgi:two-component system KDP operon response regulator KdpE
LQTTGEAPVFHTGQLVVDLVNRRVKLGEAEVHLSPKEYSLLRFLVSHAGKVVTHRQLLTEVWGPAHVEDVQYLRVLMRQLRQKLEPDGAPDLLITEPGVGYRLLVLPPSDMQGR